MKAIIALLASLLLLAGCIGVSTEEYHRLKAACESEKQALGNELASQASKASSLESRLGSCTELRENAARQLQEEIGKNAALQQELDALYEARGRISQIDGYIQARTYYYDAYGPGKVPNSVRLSRIGAQVDSLADAQLSSLWQAVRACSTSSGCDAAKTEFTSYIDDRISSLSIAVVDAIRPAD